MFIYLHISCQKFVSISLFDSDTVTETSPAASCNLKVLCVHESSSRRNKWAEMTS